MPAARIVAALSTFVVIAAGTTGCFGGDSQKAEKPVTTNSSAFMTDGELAGILQTGLKRLAADEDALTTSRAPYRKRLRVGGTAIEADAGAVLRKLIGPTAPLGPVTPDGKQGRVHVTNCFTRFRLQGQTLRLGASPNARRKQAAALANKFYAQALGECAEASRMLPRP